MKKKISIMLIVLLILNSLMSFGLVFAEGDLPESDNTFSYSDSLSEGEGSNGIDGFIELNSETVTGDPIDIDTVQYFDLGVEVEFGDSMSSNQYRDKFLYVVVDDEIFETMGEYGPNGNTRITGYFKGLSEGTKIINVYLGDEYDVDPSTSPIISYEMELVNSNKSAYIKVDSFGFLSSEAVNEIPSITFSVDGNIATKEAVYYYQKTENKVYSYPVLGDCKVEGYVEYDGVRYSVFDDYTIEDGTNVNIDTGNYNIIQVNKPAELSTPILGYTIQERLMVLRLYLLNNLPTFKIGLLKDATINHIYTQNGSLVPCSDYTSTGIINIGSEYSYEGDGINVEVGTFDTSFTCVVVDEYGNKLSPNVNNVRVYNDNGFSEDYYGWYTFFANEVGKLPVGDYSIEFTPERFDSSFTMPLHIGTAPVVNDHNILLSMNYTVNHLYSGDIQISLDGNNYVTYCYGDRYDIINIPAIKAGNHEIKIYKDINRDRVFDESELAWTGSIDVDGNKVFAYDVALNENTSVSFVESYDIPDVELTINGEPVNLMEKSIDMVTENGYRYLSNFVKGTNRVKGYTYINGVKYYINEEFVVIEGAQTYDIDLSNYIEVELDDQTVNTYTSKSFFIMENSSLGQSTYFIEEKIGFRKNFNLELNAYINTGNLKITSSPENLQDGVFSFNDTIMYVDTPISVGEGLNQFDLQSALDLTDGFNNKMNISPIKLSIYKDQSLVKEDNINDMKYVSLFQDLKVGSYDLEFGFGDINENVVKTSLIIDKGIKLNTIFKSKNQTQDQASFAIKVDGREEHFNTYGEFGIDNRSISGLLPGNKEVKAYKDSNDDYCFTEDELIGTVTVQMDSDCTLELIYNEEENILEYIEPYSTPDVNIFVDGNPYDGKIEYKYGFDTGRHVEIVYSPFPVVGENIISFEDRIDGLVCYYFESADIISGDNDLYFQSSDLRKISVSKNFKDTTMTSFVNVRYKDNNVGNYVLTGTDYYIYGKDLDNVEVLAYSNDQFGNFATNIDISKAMVEGVVITDELFATAVEKDVIKDEHIRFSDLLDLKDSNGNAVSKFWRRSPVISKVSIAGANGTLDNYDLNLFDYNDVLTSYPIGSYRITADLSPLGMSESYEFTLNIAESPVIGIMGKVKFDGYVNNDDYVTIKLVNSENNNWHRSSEDIGRVMEYGFAMSFDRVTPDIYNLEIYISDEDGNYLSGKPKLSTSVDLTKSAYLEDVLVDFDLGNIEIGAKKEFPNIDIRIDGNSIQNSDYSLKRVRFTKDINAGIDFRSPLPLYGESDYYVVLNYKGDDQTKAPIQFVLGSINLTEGSEVCTIDLDISNQREITFESHISNSDYSYGLNLFGPSSLGYIDEVTNGKIAVPSIPISGYMIDLYSQNLDRYYFEKHINTDTDVISSIEIDDNFEAMVEYNNLDIEEYITFSDIVKIRDSYGNVVTQIRDKNGNGYYIPYTIKDENGTVVKQGEFKTTYDRKRYLEGLTDGKYNIVLDLSALHMDGLNADIDVSTKPDVTIIPGDTDLNGEVNALDAALALEYSLKLANLEPDQIKAADFNGDGEVNALDSSLILQKSVKLIP